MTTYSQQDPRWASKPLGTSISTIGAEGCTVTAIGNYLGVTPDIVVDRLNAVGGFAPVPGTDQKKLVIWAKIKEAFPGVYIEEPYIRIYNNDEVLNNIPCLVEVDFDGTPRTDDRHWVLFIGDHKMVDPWTGTVESTSKYPLRGHRIIKGTWKQEQPQIQGQYFVDGDYKLDYTNQESMRVAFDVWVRLQKGLLVDKAQFEQQLTATTTCQTQLKTALDQNEELQRQKKELQSKYDESERTVIALKNEISAIHKEDANYGQEALDAQHLAKDRGEYINAIADEAGITYSPAEEKQTVENILDEIANLKDYKELKQETTETVKTYPQGLPVEVVKTNIFTKVLNLFFQ